MKNLVDLMNFRHIGDLSDCVSLYCKKIGNVEENHNAMGRLQGECKPQKSRKLKIFGFLLVALLLLVAGGAYYLDYQKRQTAEIDQMQTDIPVQRQNFSELAVAEDNQCMAEAGEDCNRGVRRNAYFFRLCDGCVGTSYFGNVQRAICGHCCRISHPFCVYCYDNMLVVIEIFLR